MKKRTRISWGLTGIGVAIILAACAAQMVTPHSGDGSIGANDLAGVVTSTNGPEAGVWVIAQTKDLPTPYAKIVVTDDRGRYVIPDLPRANYDVWVRGYGLVDTPRIRATPGNAINLSATLQTSAAAAAQNYPAIYWYSMLSVPEKNEFPMTGKAAVQGEWLNTIKTGGCNACHAMGTPGTRTISKELGQFGSSALAWQRRIQSGQALTQMARDINRLDANRAHALFADWTDRIAGGELPFARP
ncbi:MAG TPA: carboxypeptidase-like regulatory domain-containing protein, partial [Burkholderiales bacterium]